MLQIIHRMMDFFRAAIANKPAKGLCRNLGSGISVQQGKNMLGAALNRSGLASPSWVGVRTGELQRRHLSATATEETLVLTRDDGWREMERAPEEYRAKEHLNQRTEQG